MRGTRFCTERDVARGDQKANSTLPTLDSVVHSVHVPLNHAMRAPVQSSEVIHGLRPNLLDSLQALASRHGDHHAACRQARAPSKVAPTSLKPPITVELLEPLRRAIQDRSPRRELRDCAQLLVPLRRDGYGHPRSLRTSRKTCGHSVSSIKLHEESR
jgi:hypothetical protein